MCYICYIEDLMFILFLNPNICLGEIMSKIEYLCIYGCIIWSKKNDIQM